MKIILNFITALLVSGSVLADSNCTAVNNLDSHDILGLETFVTGNTFNSLECFISQLPPDILSLRTYIKSSLSLQGASTTHPRAIVASPKGGLFLTFNGHPSQKGYNTIEFIALDKESGPSQWIAGTLKLQNNRLSIQKNVSSCTSCHGNPIRPIWGKYPSWPNAYGGIDDWLPDPSDPGKNSPLYAEDQSASYVDGQEARLTPEKINTAIEESRAFRRFREQAIRHPRYSLLEQYSDRTSPVYPYTENYRTRNIAFRPNLILGSLMVLRENEILKKRISQHPSYRRFKNSLLHYNFCGDDFNANIESIFRQAYDMHFNKSIGTTSRIYPNLMELFGIRSHEKTLIFANDTDYTTLDEASYFSGYLSIGLGTYDLLLLDEINTWSDRSRFIITTQYDSPYAELARGEAISSYVSYFQSSFLGQSIDKLINSGNAYYSLNASDREQATDQQKLNYQHICNRLKAGSQREQQLSISQIFPVPRAAPQRSQEWPQALNSCIECHDSRSTIGQRIPFKNRQALAEWSRTFESEFGWGDLKTSINLLIMPQMTPAHHNGHRMPLGRRPLTPTEIQDIQRWVTPSR